MSDTVENSIIIAKTSKPLYRGSVFGVFSNGGELNIDDKYGIRVSKVSKDFFHLKIILYGEKPSYKVNKFFKIKKIEVPIIKYKKPEKKGYEMKVEKEVGLFDEE